MIREKRISKLQESRYHGGTLRSRKR